MNYINFITAAKNMIAINVRFFYAMLSIHISDQGQDFNNQLHGIHEIL